MERICIGCQQIFETPNPRKLRCTDRCGLNTNGAREAQRAKHEVEFVCFDGEGMGRGRNHKYVLLGCGQEQIENPEGLGLDEIFKFLYSQFRPQVAYTGFFLGYDFTQWLKRLPENRARMLLTDAGVASRLRVRSGNNPTPFPVRWGNWEFDILGMKRFKLRPQGARSWLWLCDSGSFFQASLLSVINPKQWKEPVVSQEEFEIIREGKSKRDSAQLDDDMRFYNRLENEVLARLMARLNEGFSAAGIRLKNNQWFGPGQAAQEWLKMQPNLLDTKTISKTLSSELLRAAQYTYYGGWFELFAHGHIPGTTLEYDINSAYPAIAANLPCLEHGSWLHTKYSGYSEEVISAAEGSIRLVHARVWGSDPHIGAMLHRTPTGLIVRPQQTKGWYWEDELDAAKRAGLIDKTHYYESYEYRPCDCPPPLRGLAGLYDGRLLAGKNTSQGKAYKLVYNSVYGKFAQSVGNPQYGNAIYASRITSGTRRMILDAIATHPGGTRAVLMVATDGVYFTEPHPGLPISSRMGDWECAERQNMCLFKPGVYWDDKTRADLAGDETPRFKARGVNARDFGKTLLDIDKHFRGWAPEFPGPRDHEALGREGWWPEVSFPLSFSMITCQQALQREKWFLAGLVRENHIVKQDSWPVIKRRSGSFDGKIYRSKPYKDATFGKWWEDSTPYDRSFGQDDTDEGVTPDGRCIDIIREVLYR